MVDFAALLNVNVDEIKPPAALPAGTYYGSIKEHKFGESKNNKTPFVSITVKFESPGPDISTDDLDGVDVAAKQLRKDYWLTPDALYRLKDMAKSVLEPTGIQVDGRKLDEIIPELNNMPVMVEVTQRPGETPEDPMRNDIKTITGVPA